MSIPCVSFGYVLSFFVNRMSHSSGSSLPVSSKANDEKSPVATPSASADPLPGTDQPSSSSATNAPSKDTPRRTFFEAQAEKAERESKMPIFVTWTHMTEKQEPWFTRTYRIPRVEYDWSMSVLNHAGDTSNGARTKFMIELDAGCRMYRTDARSPATDKDVGLNIETYGDDIQDLLTMDAV